MGWGKIFGLIIGSMLFSKLHIFGPILGLYFGHKLDKFFCKFNGLRGKINQVVYFRATFSVMGHIAKAKGKVTQNEIDLANGIMDQMRLQGEMRKKAQDAFRQGKSSSFPLESTLFEVKRACHDRNDLLHIFLELQIQAAFADGDIDPQEREIIYTIGKVFGIPQEHLDQRLSMQDGAYHFNQGGDHWNPQIQAQRLKNAYAILGLEEGADAKAVKRAYRKLMNEHHPDKLAASGLPPEMMEMAKQKSQEIQAAYEVIKKQQAV